MSDVTEMDLGATKIPFAPEKIEPVWRSVKQLPNASVWEVQLCSHELLGALSAQIAWLEDSKQGSLVLFRNGAAVGPLSMNHLKCDIHDLDSFKGAAWEAVFDHLTSVSVFLQNYIARGVKVTPTSENVSVGDV